MPTSTTKTMPYTWVHEASSRGQFFRNLAYAPRFNEKQRPRTSMMSCQPKRRCVACVAHWPIPAPPPPAGDAEGETGRPPRDGGACAGR